MKENRPLEYVRTKLAALQGLASGGDKAAAKELNRRGVALVSPDDVTAAAWVQLRAKVLAWRDGGTEVEKAASFHLAQRAQDELVARWRTRSALGWRMSDAHIFGPLHIDGVPAAPWTIPRPPRCISWQRPMSSTLYPSEIDIQKSKLNAYARSYYAAGAPQPKE